jgi:rhodanese-related sulfurtransferase
MGYNVVEKNRNCGEWIWNMKSLIRALISLLVILDLMLSGCAANNLADSPVFKDISVQEAAELIKNNGSNPDFTILDVRTPEEFKAGHIAGALNLDFYSTTFSEELAKLKKTNTYFVYCRSGNRSGQAMKIMESMGFKKVYNLASGFVDWTAGGLPSVK